jgi:hypothetical protein
VASDRDKRTRGRSLGDCFDSPFPKADEALGRYL